MASHMWLQHPAVQITRLAPPCSAQPTLTTPFLGRRPLSRPAQRVQPAKQSSCTTCSLAGTPPNSQHDSHKVSTAGLKSEQGQQATCKPAWQQLALSVAKGAAVGALALALAFGHVGPAEAARSGGRVGGSAFSSSRSYSGGSSRSYSGGSSRSYSGGGSSLGGLGSSRGYSRSYGGSSVAPSLSFGFGLPFGYGYGYGYPAPVVVNNGGGGFVNFIFLAIAAFVLLQIVQTALQANNGGEVGGGRVAVAKLQVGLLGSARSLQRDLERIASRADTSSSEGLNFVLQETVLALLRAPEYCVYGAAEVKSARDPEGAEERFNELSMAERGKFEEETLVNVGGRERRSSYSKRRGDGMNELIVVTILVAADGNVSLPQVTSREQLRTALQRLGALRSDQVMAVEVLWTPQDEGDYFTRDEVMVDYPELNTL